MPALMLSVQTLRSDAGMFILIDCKAGHPLLSILLQLRLQLGTAAEGAAAAGVERAARRRVYRAR